MTLIRTTITDVHYCITTDGIYTIAHDARGAEYVHEWIFRVEKDAAKFTIAVRAEMTIDPARWSYRAPYGSRAWIDDGCEQAEIEREREELDQSERQAEYYREGGFIDDDMHPAGDVS